MNEIGNAAYRDQPPGTSGEVERIFETPGPVNLRVQNPSGKVEIETHAAQKTEVRVIALGRYADEIIERTRITDRATSRGHEVTVEIRQGRGKPRFHLGNGAAVGVSVRVPPDTTLDVSTSSASISAPGTYRAAAIRSASGAIDLGDIAEGAKLQTASGDIRAGTVGDALDVQTASGEVQIEAAAAGGKVSVASGRVNVDRTGKQIRVQSASGDVRIGDAPEGARVETVSGDVRIERASGGELILRTVSGDVAVAVVQGTLIRFDAGSLSGKVSSDIQVETDRPESAQDAPSAGGELLVQAKTVAGNIRVTRAGD